MRWDELGWGGVKWDGMRRVDGMGWDGMGWDSPCSDRNAPTQRPLPLPNPYKKRPYYIHTAPTTFTRAFPPLCCSPLQLYVHRSSVIGHRSSVIGHRLSVIRHQSSVISYRSSVIGHPSSVNRHQSSVIISRNLSVYLQLLSPLQLPSVQSKRVLQLRNTRDPVDGASAWGLVVRSEEWGLVVNSEEWGLVVRSEE